MIITNIDGEEMEFNYHDGDIVYKNPYGKVNGFPSKKDFVRCNPRILEIEGGMIVQVHCSQFDYLIDGEVVTQRAGASVELLKLMIKEGLKPLDYDHQFKIKQLFDAQRTNK